MPELHHTTCACCGYKTLDKNNVRGNYDICKICFWEDEPDQFLDPDLQDSCNHGYSLRQAQHNYLRIGAMCKEMLPHVRKALPTDKKDPNWKLL